MSFHSLLFKTSYLVTIETDYHWTYIKMRARDKRTENRELQVLMFYRLEKKHGVVLVLSFMFWFSVIWFSSCHVAFFSFLKKCRANEITCFSSCLHGGGGPQIGEVTFGGSPHLSCKRDQNKMKDDMDRRAIPGLPPPKRFTAATWGPPPPWKQLLRGWCLDCVC